VVIERRSGGGTIQFPGWELHPLEVQRLSRRTVSPTTVWSIQFDIYGEES